MPSPAAGARASVSLEQIQREQRDLRRAAAAAGTRRRRWARNGWRLALGGRVALEVADQALQLSKDLHPGGGGSAMVIVGHVVME